MPSIIPAVIPESKEHLLATLEMLSAFAAEAQVDITDGQFAGVMSWPYRAGTLEDELSEVVCPLPIELDLMISQPETSLDAWMALKPARVVVHLESVNDIEAVFTHHGNRAYKLGIALNNDTELEKLFMLDPASFDYVELMGISEIGMQGLPFDERVLERIGKIKAARPQLEVSIDGSVNIGTLPRLREAGADRFVVGSAILKADDPATMYKQLSALTE